ncbi:MAG: glycosyltransferase [Candidatus Magasanikbacteria bacterium]|nr:glycosyltransferase [Candidatus Magasanikbacteria bacterium]
MKIAIITPVFPPYLAGIGNVAAQQATGLKQKGMKVAVFTPDYGKDVPGDGVRRLKPFLKFGNAAWILNLDKELADFDIIHLHYPFIGVIDAVLRCKKPLVVTYHMDLVDRGWKWLFFKIYIYLTLSKVIKKADKILVSSMDYAQHGFLAPYLKKWPEKFVEASFGVELPRDIKDSCLSAGRLRCAQNDKNEIASALPRNDNKMVLFVGALDKAHYFKGVDILLDAMKDLKYKLIIVGDGDLRSHYEEKAKKLKMCDRVIFVGRVSDEKLSEYYQSADVFVLPSIDKSEAYGMVLLEAMAHGLPVVASNLSGVRSLVGEDRGLLVEPGNIKELALALTKILSDDENRRVMGLAAKKWVEENMTVKKEINKIVEIYSTLANDKLSC